VACIAFIETTNGDGTRGGGAGEGLRVYAVGRTRPTSERGGTRRTRAMKLQGSRQRWGIGGGDADVRSADATLDFEMDE